MAFTSSAGLAGLNVEAKGLRCAPAVFSDTALNDSNKTLDLGLAALNLEGALQAFWMTTMRLEFTLTTVTGTRSWAWRILDNSADVLYVHSFSTGFHGALSDAYNINQGIGNEVLTSDPTADRRDRMPNHMWLRPDWQIQVLDTGATDPAADDMVVHIGGIAYYI